MPPLRTFAMVRRLISTLVVTLSAAASNPFLSPNQGWGSAILYTENDAFLSNTDQFYTNGIKLTFVTRESQRWTDESNTWWERKLGPWVNRLLPKHEHYKLSASIGQDMFTPADFTVNQFQPDDRPYAAWSYLGLGFHAQTDAPNTPAFFSDGARLTTVELTVGVTGPEAFGQEVQDWVHEKVWKIRKASGWHHQIGYRLGANLSLERKVRWRKTLPPEGWAWDFIPHIGVTLGNIHTYANTGVELRLGYKLPDDFGTKLIRPGAASSSDSITPFRMFFYGAFDARLIARNTLLESNSPSGSFHIKREPMVADFHIGVAVARKNLQFTYSQVLRTREFTSQPEHFDFGAASITCFFK